MNAQTKHTPGPWTAFIEGQEQQFGASHSICAGKHLACIAEVPLSCDASTSGEDGMTVIGHDEAIANARLIAAAPELLEALRRCIGSLRAVSPGGDGDPDVEFARAAVSKAIGEDK